MEVKILTELLGKTLASVTGQVGGEEIVFVTTEGKRYKLYHRQECCEDVIVDDICGDLNDLVGSPLIQAEEVSNAPAPSPDPHAGEYRDSWTWTFYRFSTAKGFVTIRWYGESNGYYSEYAIFSEA